MMKHLLLVCLAFLMTGSAAHGECEKAREYYERAVSPGLEPKEKIHFLNLSLKDCETFAAYYELGKSYYMAKRFRDAIHSLKRAAVKTAKGNEEKAAAYYAMGRIHLANGDREKAATCYKSSLGFSPNRGVERELMGIEKDQMGKIVPSARIVTILEQGRSIGVVPSIDLRVHFDFGSHALTPEGRRQAEEIGKAMLSMGRNIRFKLVGHTDSRGSHEYNDRLSLKRAGSVRDYVMGQFEIDPERLSVEGRGERELLYHDSDEDAHALNRRVEMKME